MNNATLNIGTILNAIARPAANAITFHKVTWSQGTKSHVESGWTCPIAANKRASVLRERGMRLVTCTSYTENR